MAGGVATDEPMMLTREARSRSARPLVDIVIVNWNAGTWLERCVSSIREHGGTALAGVVVVDNGSTDGSDRLSIPDLPLTIIRAGTNLGFGRACNLGAKQGHAPYLLFLNPDAALLPGTLAAVIDVAESTEFGSVGVFGVKLVGDDGVVQRHCARFPTPSTLLAAATGLSALVPSRFSGLHDVKFDHLTTKAVDHVIGAFYLIRRDLFEFLGGFDERFFVYLEDLDLSLRVKKAGYEVRYLASATGLHYGGGTSEQVKPRRLAYALESRIAYAFKHFPWPAAIIVAGATLLVEPVPRLIRAGVRRSPAEAVETLKGFALLWRRVVTGVGRRRTAHLTELNNSSPDAADTKLRTVR